MLRGRLKSESGYLETWGTIKGLIEVWQEGNRLVLKGECTDIVELHSWFLPTIQNAYPDAELDFSQVRVPEFEAEQELLKLEIRAHLERHSDRMVRVDPERRVRQP
ncbi:MAG: hypothetical protein ABIK62_02785 [candidate division WOR-3 bacterium]